MAVGSLGGGVLLQQKLFQFVGRAQQESGGFPVAGDQLSDGQDLGRVQFVRKGRSSAIDDRI